MTEGVSAVPFSEEHIERAAEIEKLTFSEPWSKEAMKLLCAEDYPSLALIDGSGRLVGYISSAKALDELQIINVAVAKECRGRGYGSLLMSAFEELCEELCVDYVSLEVRESNAAAIALYEKFGYSVAGKRKRFYRAPVEDALIMIKDRRSHGAEQGEL